MTMPLTMSLLALVAVMSFITTLTPVEARQQAPHQPANTDEDLQVNRGGVGFCFLVGFAYLSTYPLGAVN